jgi:hypothetical protein
VKALGYRSIFQRDAAQLGWVWRRCEDQLGGRISRSELGLSDGCGRLEVAERGLKFLLLKMDVGRMPTLLDGNLAC